MTAEEVGREINCSMSKVTRIETGKRSATPDDFAALMELLEVPESEQVYLEQLFRQGRRRTTNWWDTYGNVLSSRYAEYIGYEHEADNVFDYQIVFVPSLLQTEEYARGVTSVGFAALGPDQIDTLVEIKMRRQRRIRDDRPVRLNAVITQAALEFHVGGPEAQVAQLRYLRAAMELSNVDLRVIPYSKGEDGTLPGAFSTFQVDGQELPEAAFAEAVIGSVLVEDALGLRRLRRLSSYLTNAALSPDETFALIEQTERKLTSP